jgi:hypothetical protein
MWGSAPRHRFVVYCANGRRFWERRVLTVFRAVVLGVLLVGGTCSGDDGWSWGEEGMGVIGDGRSVHVAALLLRIHVDRHLRGHDELLLHQLPLLLADVVARVGVLLKGSAVKISSGSLAKHFASQRKGFSKL